MRPWLFALLLVACGPKRSPEAAVPPTPVAAAPVDRLGPLPTPGAERPWTPPAAKASALSNGVSLWVVEQPSLPLVSLVLRVPSGSTVDTLGKEGTASLSNRLMTRGAGKLDSTAFAEAIERLGASLEVHTTRGGSELHLSVHRDRLGPALDLAALAVLQPTYTNADFAQEKELALSELAADRDDPRAVADALAWATWFGKAHPLGRPPGGTISGMEKTTLKDVKSWHAASWVPGGAQLTVAGAVTLEEVQAELEGRLGAGAWKGRAAPDPKAPPAPPHRGEVLLVDKPGSAQTMFYLVFPGVSAHDPGNQATRTGTIALGGTFTSRLNALLREKRGYTYGVRATAQVLRDTGVLTIGTRVRTDATRDAMVDLVGELVKIQEGLTAEELGKARGADRQDTVEALAGRSATAQTYAWYQAMGLGPDGPAKDLAAMAAVTPEAVKAEMARYARERSVIVLVGDRALIEKPLVDAGFGPITVVEPL